MTSTKLDSRFWAVTLIGAALVILLPLIAMWFDAQSQVKTLYSLIPLLLCNPVIALIVTFRTSKTNGSWALLAFGVLAVAFLVSVFVIYNSSALIHGTFLVGGALVGFLLGTLGRRR